jgi:hypothetical protein
LLKNSDLQAARARTRIQVGAIERNQVYALDSLLDFEL